MDRRRLVFSGLLTTYVEIQCIITRTGQVFVEFVYKARALSETKIIALDEYSLDEIHSATNITMTQMQPRKLLRSIMFPQ